VPTEPGNDPDARGRLLRTAEVLFRRQGYAATGVKQLLDTSGTVAGSMYHHFPGGKSEIAVAVVQQAGRDIEALLRESLAKSGTRAALSRFISWLADSMRASDGLAGCPIAPVAIESPTAGEPVRAEAAAQFASWTEAITAQLRAEGHTADKADALALVLLSALEGALLLGRTAKDTAALEALRRSLDTLVPEPTGDH
jgi:TetR/AcrR family transcriptional repressor of lmrAB and yxaGH operons